MLSGFFKRLLMARQLNFMEGDVSIFDIPQVMHPANHHFHLQQTITEKCGEAGKEAIYIAGKKSAEEISQILSEKFKVSGFESVNLWQNIIELSGTAKIVSMSPREGGNATVQAQSSIAKHILKTQGIQKDAREDHYLRGFLAGVFSKIYSKEIVCEETKCMSAGDTCCEFTLKPHSS